MPGALPPLLLLKFGRRLPGPVWSAPHRRPGLYGLRTAVTGVPAPLNFRPAPRAGTCAVFVLVFVLLFLFLFCVCFFVLLLLFVLVTLFVAWR